MRDPRAFGAYAILPVSTTQLSSLFARSHFPADGYDPEYPAIERRRADWYGGEQQYYSEKERALVGVSWRAPCERSGHRAHCSMRSSA